MKRISEGKKDAIAEVQRSLEEMKEQAQEMMKKNQISLPPVCNARHYLFHSVNKSLNPQKYTKLSMAHPFKFKTSRAPSISNLSQQINKQPTIYNVQFKHLKPDESNKLMGSTSMKLKLGIHQKFARNRSIEEKAQTRYFSMMAKPGSDAQQKNKLNLIVINSQTIDSSEKNQSMNRGSDGKEKKVSKKETSIINKYQHRIFSPRFPQLNNSKAFKQSEARDISYHSNMETIDLDDNLKKQEQGLITLPRNQSIEQKENPQNYPQKQTPRKSFRQEKKMILRGNSLEKRNKPRMGEIKYSPWEDTIPIQDDEDFLVIDNKF